MLRELPVPAEARMPIPVFRQVQLMLAQLLAAPVGMLILLFIPLPAGAALLLLVYGLLLALEYRLRMPGPSSCTMLFVSLVLLLAPVLPATWLPADPLPPLAVPLLCFGALLLVSVMLLLSGRAAVFGPSGTSGSPALKLRTTVVWIAIYALGAVASWVFLHEPHAIPWLAMLPLAGVAITIVMHFFGGTGFMLFGTRCTACASSTPFTQGEFRFERVAPNDAALRPFYRRFIHEAMPEIRRGIADLSHDEEDWVALKMEADRASWPHTQFFVARADKRVVGTISCMLKTSTNTLGFEGGHTRPLSVLELCRYGPVLEVGRLSIATSHRLGRDVFQGLMRCVLEQAFAHDAAFVVAQSFSSARPVYEKIGFRAVDECVANQHGLGTGVVLMAFNLAARAVCHDDGDDVSGKLSGLASPLYAERYFKRQAARSLICREPAWRLSDADIAAKLHVTPRGEVGAPGRPSHVS